MASTAVVYEATGTDRIHVRRDIPYGASTDPALVFDLYRPRQINNEETTAAVVLTTGYRDAGYRDRLGCFQKDTQWQQCWARLIATAGLTAVTYVNQDPAQDLNRLLRFLLDNGARFGVDPGRLGFWSASGNVPNTLATMSEANLAALSDQPFLRCAALCYGHTLDTESERHVSDAAAQFGFAVPSDGATIEGLRHTPIFLVRAGRDEMPGLNASIDAFVTAALDRNFPLWSCNLPHAPHAFDLFDDNQASRIAVRAVLNFLAEHLR